MEPLGDKKTIYRMHHFCFASAEIYNTNKFNNSFFDIPFLILNIFLIPNNADVKSIPLRLVFVFMY